MVESRWWSGLAAGVGVIALTGFALAQDAPTTTPEPAPEGSRMIRPRPAEYPYKRYAVFVRVGLEDLSRPLANKRGFELLDVWKSAFRSGLHAQWRLKSKPIPIDGVRIHHLAPEFDPDAEAGAGGSTTPAFTATARFIAAELDAAAAERGDATRGIQTVRHTIREAFDLRNEESAEFRTHVAGRTRVPADAEAGTAAHTIVHRTRLVTYPKTSRDAGVTEPDADRDEAVRRLLDVLRTRSGTNAAPSVDVFVLTGAIMEQLAQVLGGMEGSEGLPMLEPDGSAATTRMNTDGLERLLRGVEERMEAPAPLDYLETHHYARNMIVLGCDWERTDRAHAAPDASGYATLQPLAEVRPLLQPSVLMELVDSETTVLVGGETVYTLTIANVGGAAARLLDVTCRVPEEMTLTRIGDRATTMKLNEHRELSLFAPNPFRPAVGVLRAGDKLVWDLTVRGDRAGDVRFFTLFRVEGYAMPIEEYERTTVYE